MPCQPKATSGKLNFIDLGARHSSNRLMARYSTRLALVASACGRLRASHLPASTTSNTSQLHHDNAPSKQQKQQHKHKHQNGHHNKTRPIRGSTSTIFRTVHQFVPGPAAYLAWRTLTAYIHLPGNSLRMRSPDDVNGRPGQLWERCNLAYLALLVWFPFG